MTDGSATARPHDVAIVGGGIAGLTAALTAADEGARVLLLAKDPLVASTSHLAQGGIAAACGEGDSPELHAQDTLVAGRGLCRTSAVTVLTEEAPERIEFLRSIGVQFDPDPGLEGGHCRRRVMHVAGAETGRAVSAALGRAVRQRPEIEVVEGHRVVAIGPTLELATPQAHFWASAVIVATGGYAALYARTTNPPGSNGEGVILGYRAGAAIADLEFVQFHPTVLAGSEFLLSEALRGDGALLLDEHGERFVDELSPRDVVARASAARGRVFLDLRPVPLDRFPSIRDRLVEEGYDPTHSPIPVSPAAHFTMGGIVTDNDGRTNVPGLYAAGECACSGVHGANRLASNSLLEGLVFGRRSALAALRDPKRPQPPARAALPEPALPYPVTPEVREALWKCAGLTRSAESLASLATSPNELARLIGVAALERRESRGGHYRTDYPEQDSHLDRKHIVIQPGEPLRWEEWT